jgi:hypothetical protein
MVVQAEMKVDMSNKVAGIDSARNRLGQLDPAGEVYLTDPPMVGDAIKAILDRLYGKNYDSALLATAIEDLVRAYRGEYPGLLRCDTLYHDLRHALETGLTAARLLDGYAKSLPSGHEQERIDGEHALLTVLLALYHDIGMQRRDTEANLWGPVLIPIHEERGTEFMRKYLSGTSLAAYAEKSILIMPTKLTYDMPDSWDFLDHKMASIIASADLMSQLADRYYLEKCRDFLFVEFSAIGLAGKTDSLYPDRETLLAKTPDFFTRVISQRMEEEYQGVHWLIAAHAGGQDPWQESIKRNIAFLEEILTTRDFGRLHRVPQTFI